MVNEINLIKNRFIKYSSEIINFVEPFNSITVIIELLIFWQLSKLINDKIVILAIVNIIIFYSIIENKCPKFAFRTRMFIKSIIEGILSTIITFIPKYQEKKI